MKGNRQSYSLSFRGELYEKMRVFYGTSRWPENVKEKTLRFFVRPKQTTQQIHCLKNGRYTNSSDFHDVRPSPFSKAGTQKAT